MKNRRLPKPLLDAYEWQDRGLCRRMPLDVFFEIAMVFDFLIDDYDDDFDVDLNAAIGVRYWFE